MSTRDVPEQVGDLPRIGRPATSALLAGGVSSLEQVARWSERELLALHGVGPRAVAILRRALAEQGRDLAAGSASGHGGSDSRRGDHRS